MRRPKVIVGDIRDKVLGQIVERVLSDKLGVKVVARGIDPAVLESEAERLDAKVIVLGLENNDIPPLCERLLSRLDNAVVVGLLSDMGSESGPRRTRIAVYQSGDLGPNELADTILTAMQKSLEQYESGRKGV